MESAVLLAVAAEAFGPGIASRAMNASPHRREGAVVVAQRMPAARQESALERLEGLEQLKELRRLQELRRLEALRPLGGALDRSPLAAFDLGAREHARAAATGVHKRVLVRPNARAAVNGKECEEARRRKAPRAPSAPAAPAAASNLRRQAAV